MQIQNKIPFAFLIFWCVFIGAGCFASQNQYSKTLTIKHAARHQEKLEPGAELIRARVHYSFERTPDGRYIYKQYYPEREIKTIHATYKDERMTMLHGEYKTWDDHGGKSSEGTYVNGKRSGKWTDYREEGAYTVGKFDQGEYVGNWVTYNKDGSKSSIIPMVDNAINGTAKYYENGVLTRKANYEDNKVISTEELVPDTEGNKVFKKIEESKIAEEMPLWNDPKCSAIEDFEARTQCGNKKMLEFIYRNIRYPGYCREEDIQGTAVVRFIVNKDGSLGEIEATRGICTDIERECLRVVRLMPRWIAGKQEGELVKVYFNLPIKFKLE